MSKITKDTLTDSQAVRAIAEKITQGTSVVLIVPESVSVTDKRYISRIRTEVSKMNTFLGKKISVIDETLHHRRIILSYEHLNGITWASRASGVLHQVARGFYLGSIEEKMKDVEAYIAEFKALNLQRLPEVQLYTRAEIDDALLAQARENSKRIENGYSPAPVYTSNIHTEQDQDDDNVRF